MKRRKRKPTHLKHQAQQEQQERCPDTCHEPQYMKEGFCCPSEIPAEVPDTFFSAPHICQPKIPTKRFTSPITGLSPEALEQLTEFIEKTNELLLALGSPRDPETLTGFRVRFERLVGLAVRIEFDCEDKKGSVVGIIKEAGRDFVQIIDVEKRCHFIPYLRVCAIHQDTCDCEMEEHMGQHHHRVLSDIDPHLRRALVLDFGKVVSQSPELIQIFFGIPLFLKMAEFIGCRITLKIEGEEETVRGVLLDSVRDKICVRLDEKKKDGACGVIEDDDKDDENIRKIDIEKICVAMIENCP